MPKKKSDTHDILTAYLNYSKTPVISLWELSMRLFVHYLERHFNKSLPQRTCADCLWDFTTQSFLQIHELRYTSQLFFCFTSFGNTELFLFTLSTSQIKKMAQYIIELTNQHNAIYSILGQNSSWCTNEVKNLRKMLFLVTPKHFSM